MNEKLSGYEVSENENELIAQPSSMSYTMEEMNGCIPPILDLDFLENQSNVNGQAIKVGDIWTNIISSKTGKQVNYRETSLWWDGSIMDDGKLDGVIYVKKEDIYLKKTDVKYLSSFILGNEQTIDNALRRACNLGFDQIIIEQGEYIISDAITINKPLVLKGEGKVKISGNNKNFINLSANLELHNLELTAFSIVIECSASKNDINKIKVDSCHIHHCTNLLNWKDILKERKIEYVELSNNVITDFADFAVLIEPSINKLVFNNNECRNIVRYLIRALEGEESISDKKYNFHLTNNKVIGLNNAAFIGSLGVARVFQFSCENAWIENNYFEDIQVNENGTGNANIAYYSARNITISGNYHKNCGGMNTTTYLYHNKSSVSVNTSILNNKFIQDKTYRQGCIHAIGRNIIIKNNQFMGISGRCSYVGWNDSENVIYSENEHLNINGSHAVAFYGSIKNIIHSGNIYNGIKNEDKIVESGRNGAWCIDIMRSSGGSHGAINFQSFNNTYTNVDVSNYKDTGITPIYAAAVLYQDNTMENISFYNETFIGMQDAINLRGSYKINGFYLDQCKFINVLKPISKTSAPLNYKIGYNNIGFTNRKIGQNKLQKNITTERIEHGLLIDKDELSNVRILVIPQQLQTISVENITYTTFDVRRENPNEELIVDWIAQIVY